MGLSLAYSRVRPLRCAVFHRDPVVSRARHMHLDFVPSFTDKDPLDHQVPVLNIPLLGLPLTPPLFKSTRKPTDAAAGLILLTPKHIFSLQLRLLSSRCWVVKRTIRNRSVSQINKTPLTRVGVIREV